MIRMLHIERDYFYQYKVKEMAESINVKYLCASTIDDCYNELKSGTVDLIIGTLRINDTHVELIINKLNESEFSNIPVFVLAEHDNLEMRKRLFKMGIVDYLIKDKYSLSKIKRYIESNMLQKKCRKNYDMTKIAVIDDSKLTLQIIKRIFDMQGMICVDYFDDPSIFMKSSKTFDIYIIDLVLPGISGEELVYTLRKKNAHSIIILISSITNYKTISHLLNSGANDYIMKPFDGQVFMARIKGHLRTFKLLKELDELNGKLFNLSITDGLSQLVNHQHLMVRLEEEINRAQRYGLDLSIVLMDIDDFKKVNDTYGHLIGDAVIQGIAKILQVNVRNYDIVARYGGEEFMIILPNTSSDEAYVVANKIRAAIENERFKRINLHVTVSAGIATNSENGMSYMINDADEKLYVAKKNGKNQICR